MNGWTTSEWLSLKPSDYLTSASLNLVMEALGMSFAAQRIPEVDPNRVRTLELEQYRKDGTTFWTEVSARSCYDDTGSAIGIIGATRDISERKRSEDSSRGSSLRSSRPAGNHSDHGSRWDNSLCEPGIRAYDRNFRR